MDNKEFIESWFDCKVNNQRVKRHHYGHLYADDDGVYSYGQHFPLAVLCENGFLLNGDRYSNTTTTHQSLTRSACMEICAANNLKFAVIPFTVLNNANLIPIRKIEIIDKLEEQYREIEYTDKNGKKRVREEHLLGGSVIRYCVRYFLSSTDPSATWGNGYFLTELVEPVKTVPEAFESLKPLLVRQTPPDLILRQGEWFFVKTDQGPFIKSIKITKGIKSLGKIALRNEYLPSGDSSRPHHRATRLIHISNEECDYFARDEKSFLNFQIVPGFYCRGTIRHDNREHRMLKLGNGKEWYLAIHNRQVRSWSYDGRVD